MPATERSFTEIPPSHLYVDSDFVAACLVSTEPHHGRCAAFVDRLIEHGLTTLHLSALLWIEFAHYITKEAVRNRLTEDLRAKYQLDRWQEKLIRERYLEAMLQFLYDFLSHFDWEEMDFTGSIRAVALSNMVTYGLKSLDAAHLATANALNVVDFASFDRVYRRVDGLLLWNDRIHDHANV